MNVLRDALRAGVYGYMTSKRVTQLSWSTSKCASAWVKLLILPHFAAQESNAGEWEERRGRLAALAPRRCFPVLTYPIQISKPVGEVRQSGEVAAALPPLFLLSASPCLVPSSR